MIEDTEAEARLYEANRKLAKALALSKEQLRLRAELQQIVKEKSKTISELEKKAKTEGEATAALREALEEADARGKWRRGEEYESSARAVSAEEDTTSWYEAWKLEENAKEGAMVMLSELESRNRTLTQLQ